MLRERAQRVVSSSGVTPSTLGHPTGGGGGWCSQRARKSSVESLVGFFSPVDNGESGCFQREISFSNPGHLDCDFPREQRNSRFPLS